MKKEKQQDTIGKVAWDLFKHTGLVAHYLLYRQLYK